MPCTGTEEGGNRQRAMATAPEAAQESAMRGYVDSLKQEPDGSSQDQFFRAIVHQHWDEVTTAGWLKDETFCKTTDKRGLLPLHVAVSHGAPLPIVECLLRTFPRAASVPDSDGATPLAHAVSKQANMDVIAALLRTDPKVAGTPCKSLKTSSAAGRAFSGSGYTPLHWALANRLQGVPELLLNTKEGKRSAAVVCQRGCTPLHTACAHGADVGTLEALIGANKSALQLKDVHSALPLHHAANKFSDSDADEDLASLATVIKAWPPAAKVCAVDGATPLHFAASGQSSRAVETLVDAWSAALKEPDHQGRTPLHVACASVAPEPIIRSLLHHKWVGASAAQQTDSRGCTALHLACSKTDTDGKVIGMLLKAFPGAAMHQAHNGCTPLHLAGRDKNGYNRDADKTSLLLVQAAPDALLVRDKRQKSAADLLLSANLKSGGRHGPAAAMNEECGCGPELRAVVLAKLEDFKAAAEAVATVSLCIHTTIFK